MSYLHDEEEPKSFNYGQDRKRIDAARQWICPGVYRDTDIDSACSCSPAQCKAQNVDAIHIFDSSADHAFDVVSAFASTATAPTTTTSVSLW